MRPVKLTLSAFGPFADKKVIDMDKLGDRGIYLVTGDTGAGKTTIFDAIVFALYGEASGDMRSADLFRSKYADENTPTYVELEFVYRDEKYVVRRNPEYVRPVKKGTGTTTQGAEATLIYPNGDIVTKTKEVTQAIIQLLGLDKKQFSQIAMIAQGDFLKLIMARTEDRREIFREIFNTKAYLVLQEKLKSNSSELHGMHDDLYKSVEQYINGIIIEEDDEEYDYLKDARTKKDINSIVQIVEKVKQRIDTDKSNNKTFEKEIKKLEKDVVDLNNGLIHKANIENLHKEIDKITSVLEKQEKEIVNLKDIYKGEENNKSIREQLNKEIVEAEARLIDIRRLSHICSDIDKLKGQHEELGKKKIEFEERQLGYRKKIGEIQEVLKNNSEEKLRQKYIDNITKEEQLIKEKDRLESVKRKLLEYHRKLEIYEKVKVKYIEESKTYEEYTNQYYIMEKQYMDEQAGVLASRLEDGQPCPVCGSMRHPCKAVLTENAPSKEMLDSLKVKREDQEQICKKYSNESGEIKGSIDSINKDIVETVTSMLGEVLVSDKWDIDEIDCKINERCNIIDQMISLNNQEKKLIEEEEENRRKDVSLLENLNSQVEEIAKRIVICNSDIVKCTTEIDTLSKEKNSISLKVNTANYDEAVEIINKKKAEKRSLDKAYEKARADYESAQKNIDESRSKIKVLTKQLNTNKGDIKGSIEDLKEKLGEVKNQIKSIRLLREKLVVKINTNETALNSIRRNVDKIREVEKRWTMVKQLSNTANGNISGKSRIFLETYIQMAYFDRILIRANSRLMLMSGGQYELTRRVDSKDLRSQIGLELDVIDHYNGTNRSVKSLSGGEAFKASLALALGLSDEVQSISGGIQLDTMFIDEGFGSLDEDSLDSAIRTLNDLGKGNRLIGIISHVKELKSRIDKQIVVNKTREHGSEVMLNI